MHEQMSAMFRRLNNASASIRAQVDQYEETGTCSPIRRAKFREIYQKALGLWIWAEKMGRVQPVPYRALARQGLEIVGLLEGAGLHE